MIATPRTFGFKDYIVTAWITQWGSPETVELRVRAHNAKDAASEVRRAGYHDGILSVRRAD